MGKSFSAIFAATVLGLMVSAQAATVFTWEGKSGNQVYSDIPRKLSTENVGTMNIRSHTVTRIDTKESGTASAGGQIGSDSSLAEQQAALNAKITEQQRQTEEQNKKVAESNKEAQLENCKRAQMNLQNVQTSNRVNNRDQLAASYQADIQRFCVS